jgi:SAM-dependent methyltransferase
LDQDSKTAAGREALRRELLAYGAAGQTLNGWISGARALALLRGALSSGIFDAARTPSTAGEISAATGVKGPRVADACLALEAHGVFERDGESYRLSEDFAALASADALQSLPDLLAKERVLGRALESAASSQGAAYTELTSEEASAMALGVGMRPSSPTARSLWASALAGMAPELYGLWEGGGRHLEIGCGAANTLLSLLATIPRLSAVGVEIDGGAIAIARRRARELGVEDRVELRHADARTLAEEASFDSANWSQQFFPAEGREEVLEAAWRALKPGGYLLATMFGDPPGSAEALREPAGRSYALDRLAYGGWGVPVLGTEELREQVEGAGFEILRTTSPPPNPLTVCRGLMLARRPLI